MSRLTKALRHYLWPHHKNQYRPHLIRVKSLLVVLAAFLVVNVSVNYISTGKFQVLNYATDVTIGGLLNETNQERRAGGLDNLVLNASLNSAALAKAKHMVQYDYWAHVAPDGTTPWSFIDSAGYIYLKAGENLAYGFATSGGAVDEWMKSPGHRDNIMDDEYVDVGFGIWDGENFQGGENTVIVAMYGTPYTLPVVTTETVDSPVQDLPPAPQTVAEPEPEPEPEPEAPVEEEEPEVVYSGPLTVYRGDGDGPTYSGEVAADGITGRVVTNLEALLTGNAPIMMYVSIGLLFVISLIYMMRHVRAVHQFILYGEHQLDGHPLLEASMIYVLIWLVLTATYGVIV